MNYINDVIQREKFFIKCPYKMEPEFVVIHNTANDASAKNEVAYMKKSPSATSYHFAVDDLNVIQALPLDRNAWHAGDGETGAGNRKGIAIEICYSKSGGEKFLKAEKNAARLAADILNKYGFEIERLKKHQDFSGKYCPHKTLDLGWSRFKKMVEKCLIAEKLAERGILSAKDYWMEKLFSDENLFMLLKNVLSYIEEK